MNALYDPIVQATCRRFRNGETADGPRCVAEEIAIAITYNRMAYAVMMATPADLEDFAVGFSLSEGIVSWPEEIEALEIVPRDLGIELRMDLSDAAADRYLERRRSMAGPVGCGLCGLESLQHAVRALPTVGGAICISEQAILSALADLPLIQTINQRTRAVHAAAFWRLDSGLEVLREDLGRHNALDKLAGALARRGIPAANGVVFISSRVSVEMVQKAAMMGTPILVAISAPTAMAIRTAEKAGISLVAIARDDGFEVFTGAHRIAKV